MFILSSREHALYIFYIRLYRQFIYIFNVISLMQDSIVTVTTKIILEYIKFTVFYSIWRNITYNSYYFDLWWPFKWKISSYSYKACLIVHVTLIYVFELFLNEMFSCFLCVFTKCSLCSSLFASRYSVSLLEQPVCCCCCCCGSIKQRD